MLFAYTLLFWLGLLNFHLLDPMLILLVFCTRSSAQPTLYLDDNWAFKSLLNGIKRVKGSSIKQELPVTVEFLRRIFKLSNMHISYDASF